MAVASPAAARRAAATAPARKARPATRTSRSTAATSRSRATARNAVARPAHAPRRPAAPIPARLVPVAVGRTAGAVSGLADSGVVHRLTRGRLWIGALTTLLVGIVSLNVLSLSFNASSSKVGRQADGMKREISALRAKIATDGASNARVTAAAADLGLIVPEPGSVRYLRPSADDAAVAAKRLASGELAAEPSYSASASIPAVTPTPTAPPVTGQPPVAEQPAAATEPAPTATATTADPATPPAGAPAGGGGVSVP